MEKLTEDQLFHFLPRAVVVIEFESVESRWREGKYVPEVLTVDGNFVCGPPESTHEAATDVAEKQAQAIIDGMIEVCRGFTSGMKKAKA